MSIVRALFLSAICLLSASAQTTLILKHKATGGNANGYAHKYSITVNASQVPSAQTNFPMLLSGTYAGLADTGHSGYVNNTASVNGVTVPTDVIFTSDSAGSTLLSWEIESWTNTSGAIVAWINWGATNTIANGGVIYMWVGKSSATSYQCTASSTWTSQALVLHMAQNAANTTVVDSSVNNGAAAAHRNTSLIATAKIDGAFNFASASSDAVTVPQSSHFNLHASAFTISAWILDDTSGATLAGGTHKVVSWYDGTKYIQLFLFEASNNREFGLVNESSGAAPSANSATAATGWNYVVTTFDGTSTYAIYLNGSVSSGTVMGAIGTASIGTTSLFVGQRGDGASYLNGTLDEVRISTVARSANWITAEYNNQSAPGTFYAVAQIN